MNTTLRRRRVVVFFDMATQGLKLGQAEYIGTSTIEEEGFVTEWMIMCFFYEACTKSISCVTYVLLV